MDFNVDYSGNDIPRGTFYGVLTASECASRCIAFPGCQYWSW